MDICAPFDISGTSRYNASVLIYTMNVSFFHKSFGIIFLFILTRQLGIDELSIPKNNKTEEIIHI